MDIIDNINKTLKEDLSQEIKKGSKLSIAAACFSIYAFQELKKQLESVDELRFIFTSPTFTTEKAKKEKREFYIPQLNRERNLYGSEFEVRLRNELSQKVIAKECAEWVRKKVTFKSNVTNETIGNFMINDETVYAPINGFTTVDLGCERGNVAMYMVNKLDEAGFAKAYLDKFNAVWNDKQMLQDVTDEVLDNITTAYNENSPDFIYFLTLYNIFNEFLEDISEDYLPNEATGFKESKIWNMLYNFQKDAALAIINKLEKYNGCILADSVGLGKTFTALSVIKYYENRNKTVTVFVASVLSAIASPIILAILKSVIKYIGSVMEDKALLKSNKKLEKYKSLLDGKNYVYKVQFDIEIEAYRELTKLFIEMLAKFDSLYSVDFDLPGQPHWNDLMHTSDLFHEAGKSLCHAQNSLYGNKMFMPTDKYDKFHVIYKDIYDLFIEYRDEFKRDIYRETIQNENWNAERENKIGELQKNFNKLSDELREYLYSLKIID